MIDLALQHLATELTRFLKSGSSGAEDVVALTGLMEADGSANPAAQNRLVMFLCGLEKASVLQQGLGTAPVLDPYMLDLYFMVAANFSAAQHAQALRSLSAAICFFHRQPLFDRHSTPDLAPGIERLVVDLHNLKPPEAAAIWGAIGARYLPSVMYRVRMVAGDGAAAAGRPAL